MFWTGPMNSAQIQKLDWEQSWWVLVLTAQILTGWSCRIQYTTWEKILMLHDDWGERENRSRERIRNCVLSFLIRTDISTTKHTSAPIAFRSTFGVTLLESTEFSGFTGRNRTPWIGLENGSIRSKYRIPLFRRLAMPVWYKFSLWMNNSFVTASHFEMNHGS